MWSKQLGCTGLGGLQTKSPSPYELVVFTSLNLFILICEVDEWRATLIGSQQKLDEALHTIASILYNNGSGPDFPGEEKKE